MVQYRLFPRSERRSREDAGAPVPDQQMRPAPPRYPVDRYLVESSKTVEMVNIIDDEIWNPEPTLRPEDEIILRKLHDMLQTTADDLKMLSGEMAKFHEPRVQVKSQPTPLDDEFNEKVHIEEIVNAKFHGYKIVEKSSPFSTESKPKKEALNELLANKLQKPKAVNASVQVNAASNKRVVNNKALQMTRPKVIQIKETNSVAQKETTSKGSISNKNTPTISYKEIIHEYVEPKKTIPVKQLQVQNMPVINIRSELKPQKVLQLDILPESQGESQTSENKNNVGVIAIKHETTAPVKSQTFLKPTITKETLPKVSNISNKPVRKISKMSTCESSESTTNVSSDAQHQLHINKQLKFAIKTSPKNSSRINNKNEKVTPTKKFEKRPHLNLDDWKKKLNVVYGQPSSSRNKESKLKKSPAKRVNIPSSSSTKPKINNLNNAEYIPYSKLTLGGVNVSDIEREISNLPNKNEIPLSPILDKILSSRENSFYTDSPRKQRQKENHKVLTTSDENLLQEVMDIEKTISETLSKTFKKSNVVKENETKQSPDENGNDNGESDSYDDDFEDDDKSNDSASPKHNNQSAIKKPQDDNTLSNQDQNLDDDSKNTYENNQDDKSNADNPDSKIQNITFTKISNLSFKNQVDIFEFVHSVDTQETGTQSNSTSKISLKETQTSPRNDKSNLQPIRNDLWPPLDPKGEVEKLFELEKEVIKKLIIDEYGDILEKNINKPSTSSDKDREDRKNNVSASQKNTQTSPAHVKCVMTSPTRTKTRTTSPFSVSLIVDRQTSPMILVTNEEDLKIEIGNEAEDLGISINLSSPRFSLRLPQNSRDVLSNLGDNSRTSSKQEQKNNEIESKTLRKHALSSSSSVDAYNTSSEISSLGEVKLKLRRKFKKNRALTISESSSSSLMSQYSSGVASGDILPLKSEGELSLGQTFKKPSRRKDCRDSDGEVDL